MATSTRLSLAAPRYWSERMWEWGRVSLALRLPILTRRGERSPDERPRRLAWVRHRVYDVLPLACPPAPSPSELQWLTSTPACLSSNVDGLFSKVSSKLAPGVNPR